MAIELGDILRLRAKEAEAEAVFDEQTRMARRQLRKKAKSDEKLRALVASLDMAGTISMPMNSDLLVA